jgi:hypothetical protein
MLMIPGRLVLASAALLFLGAPPIYPGALPDAPPVASSTVGAEATRYYVTPDAFEKVDAFYRSKGTEDTGARVVTAASKRALYTFKDATGEVLISWPRVGTTDSTTIMIYPE